MNKKILVAIIAALLAAVALIVGLWFAMKPKAASPERVQQSVALVFQCTDLFNGGKLLGSATAFVVDDKGHMVTNAHVAAIKDDETGGYRPLNKGEKLYVCYTKVNAGNTVIVIQEANVINFNPSRDLALLHVDNLDRSCLKPLALGNPPTVGARVRAFGYPGIFDLTTGNFESLIEEFVFSNLKSGNLQFLKNKVTIKAPSTQLLTYLKAVTSTGNVNRVEPASKRLNGGKVIIHGASIHGGMSGGPLVDDTGSVVGVTYAVGARIEDENGKEVVDFSDMNLAVSVDELKNYLDLLHTDHTQPPYYMTGDPDSFTRVIRSYVSKAETYQLALAGVGLVVCLGALITLFAMVLGKSDGDDEEEIIYEDNQQQSQKPNFPPVGGGIDNGPTQPFGQPGNGPSGNERTTTPYPGANNNRAGSRLILSGRDPNGNPLRFAITEDDLRVKRNIVLGKLSSCDVCLPFDYVSRRHACLHYRVNSTGMGCLYITDEGATNKTKLNGVPLEGEKSLNVGDTISLGSVTLTISQE